MKRGATDHPKMADLARRLGVPLYVAVGVMECLWHWAAKYAPGGDVGKWGSDGIAEGIKWDRPADELVAALVASRFLDDTPEYGLVIHDWPEHADDAVHLSMARAGRVFWDGSVPRMSRLGRNERAACEQKYARHTHDVRTEYAPTHAPPSPPLPSHALPSPPIESVAVVVRAGGEVQERGDNLVTLTPRQAELYHALKRTPDGFSSPWITLETIRDLVCLPHVTEGLIREAKRRARQAERTKANNPASFAIKFLRKPDPGVYAAITAQESST